MEDIEQRSQEFFTSCEQCGFAEFENLGEFKGQVGCKVGRLKKWKELGKTSILFNDTTNTQYYQINTFCNYLRSMQYTANFTNSESQVKIDSAAQVTVAINALGTSDDDLMRIIDSLTAQTLKPSKVVVMHYKRQTPYGRISAVLRNNPICYELVNLLDSDDEEKLMDAAAKKAVGQYITFIKKPLPLEFIERINHLVNEDLRQISMITGDYLTVQLNLYNMLLGNVGQSIQSKIEEMADRQGVKSMVLNGDELCR